MNKLLPTKALAAVDVFRPGRPRIYPHRGLVFEDTISLECGIMITEIESDFAGQNWHHMPERRGQGDWL
ncbi:MAG: hypothetical protein WD491_03795 [Balneolales bacterium]